MIARDNMPIDAELDALLEAERNLPAVPHEIEARVEARLERTLAWGGGAFLGSLAARGVVFLAVVASLATGLLIVGVPRTDSAEARDVRTSPAPSSTVNVSRLAKAAPFQLLSGTAIADETRASGAFEGTVVSADTGLPVEGAELTLTHDGTAYSTRSSRDGRFVFEAPAPGKYEIVYVAANDFLSYASDGKDESAVTFIARPGQTVREVEIQLAPRTFGVGVVRDAMHGRVAGAEVRIDSDDRLRSARTLTDARGEFTLELRPGDRIIASHSRFGWGEKHLRFLPELSQPIEIDLDRESDPTALETVSKPTEGSGVVHGHVRGTANHAPVAAFTVIVWSSRGAMERQAVARRSFFDANGEFDIRGLPPGNYGLMAVARDFAPSAAIPVSIGADEAVLDVELDRGARVSGVVVDERTKGPLEGARVALELLLQGEHAISLSGGTTTDKSGRFDLLGVTPGRASLVVTEPNHDGRLVSGLDAKASADLGPLRVELAPTKPGNKPRFELTGIGAALKGKDDALLVDAVLDGGGAQAAGLRAGDEIVAIDGVDVHDFGFNDAIQHLRGLEDTEVRVRVRQGSSVSDVTIRRRRVRINR